jgi:2-succinyl-5-enolpyruvyl-6-hydroxy-3-cyclohexene-1-carboxylate synthase
VALDPWWQWSDPSHVVGEFLHCDVDEWVAAARPNATMQDPTWLHTWQEMEATAQAAMTNALGDTLSEPLVARLLIRYATQVEADIVASASMPMRDLEWFAPTLPVPPQVRFNRGANGIDGVVSTALGIAASGRRTFALMGDLAFLHDVSGLVNLENLPCTFVVLDNGGGGIFSFLPQANALSAERFELLFGTPPTSDVSDVARGFGLSVREVTSIVDFEAALLEESAPGFIRVMVPGRSENVALHEKINQAVQRALV